MEPEGSLPHSQVPAPCPRPRSFWTVRNTIHFDREELLAPRPNLKLEDHPLSAFRDCIFDIFAATLHIGRRFSTRNLRTRHAVVPGTHVSWDRHNEAQCLKFIKGLLPICECTRTSWGSASKIMNESFHRSQNVSLIYTELQTLAETLGSHLGYRTLYWD